MSLSMDSDVRGAFFRRVCSSAWSWVGYVLCGVCVVCCVCVMCIVRVIWDKYVWGTNSMSILRVGGERERERIRAIQNRGFERFLISEKSISK